MRQLSIVLILVAVPFVALAESDVKPLGLHMNTRILLPLDSSQNENYLFHNNQTKKISINAPLVTLEQIPEPGKKYKKLKLKTSASEEVSDENQD